MCEFDTESRKRQKQEMSERQKEMAYWGWKFEQYVTAGAYSISLLLSFFYIFVKWVYKWIKFSTELEVIYSTVNVFEGL